MLMGSSSYTSMFHRDPSCCDKDGCARVDSPGFACCLSMPQAEMLRFQVSARVLTSTRAADQAAGA